MEKLTGCLHVAEWILRLLIVAFTSIWSYTFEDEVIDEQLQLECKIGHSVDIDMRLF